MAEVHRLTIEPLDHGNWSSWPLRMQDVLQERGLWDAVLTAKDKKQAGGQASLSRVEQREAYAQVEDAYESVYGTLPFQY